MGSELDRAQVALLRGDEWTAQLRQVVGDELFTVPGAMNRVVTLSAGIAQHYDVADSVSGSDPAEPVGSIAGDVELTSGQRLADHAHDGRFVPIDRSPDGRFAAAACLLEPRLTYVPDPKDPGASHPSLLVRPDGIIIWAARHDAERSADHAPAQLTTAIGRWIGAPALTGRSWPAPGSCGKLPGTELDVAAQHHRGQDHLGA